MSGLDWPGEERRRPPMSSSTWAVRSPMAAWLEQEAARGTGTYRLLDVGCGPKPYYPFFAERASEYVGVDVVENPVAELRGSVEALPVEDASFDVVLCTQVLEHADDPAKAVREMHRVTAPGGRVLASTHGVQLYHPSPQDLWRWTHAGLARLFEQNAAWSSVTVTPGAGTTATLGLLLATYVDLVFQHLHARPLGRPLIVVLNTVAAAIDARSATLRGLGPGSLIANYHVVAEKPR
jgi:SAM-dependent methyltransferase